MRRARESSLRNGHNPEMSIRLGLDRQVAIPSLVNFFDLLCWPCREAGRREVCAESRGDQHIGECVKVAAGGGISELSFSRRLNVNFHDREARSLRTGGRERD